MRNAALNSVKSHFLSAPMIVSVACGGVGAYGVWVVPVKGGILGTGSG